MDSCKFTSFGLCVKTELLKRGRDQKWLQETVSSATGLFVDGGYMYKILTGQRNAPKIAQAIREILGLPEQDHDTT
ncbi:MAG: XRE family transcriptional regulator [Bacillota bacterium]